MNATVRQIDREIAVHRKAHVDSIRRARTYRESGAYTGWCDQGIAGRMHALYMTRARYQRVEIQRLLGIRRKYATVH